MDVTFTTCNLLIYSFIYSGSIELNWIKKKKKTCFIFHPPKGYPENCEKISIFILLSIEKPNVEVKTRRGNYCRFDGLVYRFARIKIIVKLTICTADRRKHSDQIKILFQKKINNIWKIITIIIRVNRNNITENKKKKNFKWLFFSMQLAQCIRISAFGKWIKDIFFAFVFF